MIAAPSCKTVLSQATTAWPNRDKSIDGIIPSADHRRRNPTSDHNPGRYGFCHAVDLTIDKPHGCDGSRIMHAIAAAHDGRAKLMICEHELWTPSNGFSHYAHHDHMDHLHISVQDHLHDLLDIRAWPGIKKVVPPSAITAKLGRPLISPGERTWLWGNLTSATGKNTMGLPVRIEFLYLGTWRVAKVVYTSGTAGRYGTIVKPERTCTYRARYYGSTAIPSCKSQSVKLTIT